MTPERPASITVIAILQLVFGGLVLFCTMLGLAFQYTLGPEFMAAPGNAPAGPAAKGFDPLAVQKQLEQKLPEFHEAYTVAQMIVSLGLSVIMIISGIGLLRLRPWGRVLAIVYGVLSSVDKVASALYGGLVVLPATREVVAALAEQARRGPMDPQEQAVVNTFLSWMNIGAALGVGWTVISLIYPVTVLIIMFLPSNQRAFRGETTHDFDESGPPPEPEDGWRR